MRLRVTRLIIDIMTSADSVATNYGIYYGCSDSNQTFVWLPGAGSTKRSVTLTFRMTKLCSQGSKKMLGLTVLIECLSNSAMEYTRQNR
jgi:hypothetical protein